MRKIVVAALTLMLTGAAVVSPAAAAKTPPGQTGTSSGPRPGGQLGKKDKTTTYGPGCYVSSSTTTDLLVQTVPTLLVPGFAVEYFLSDGKCTDTGNGANGITIVLAGSVEALSPGTYCSSRFEQLSLTWPVDPNWFRCDNGA